MIVLKKNLKIILGAMWAGFLDCWIFGLLDYWILNKKSNNQLILFTVIWKITTFHIIAVFAESAFHFRI